jgi:hypothetical protein
MLASAPLLFSPDCEELFLLKARYFGSSNEATENLGFSPGI